jgi:putative peptidoglycan lipid II flippase
LNYNPKCLPDRTILSTLTHHTAYPLIGIFVTESGRIIEKGIASQFEAGSIAIFYFVFRIYSAIQTLIGKSFATTLLPDLSTLAREENYDLLNKTLLKNIFSCLTISVITAVIILTFGHEILALIYGYGNFGESDILRAAELFYIFIIGLPAFCLIPVLHSYLYSVRDFKSILQNMIFTGLTYIILSFAFSNSYNINGIALAFTVAVYLSLLHLFALFKLIKRGKKH